MDELPARWAARMSELLGVDVPDDARGCLQAGAAAVWVLPVAYVPWLGFEGKSSNIGGEPVWARRGSLL